MTKSIAVVMSIYREDRPEWLFASLNSLYEQTISDFDIFLQVDGSISPDLKKVVSDFELKYTNLFVEFFEENRGLAFQLNRAISRLSHNGTYKFIARMDADDICFKNRFEKQLDFFSKNPTVAICGAGVIEFSECGSVFEKRLPSHHEVLIKNIIRRCPFSHPTVMFNLSVINVSDIFYDEKLMNTQDYYLWVDLVAKNYIIGNCQDILLRFRKSSDFFSRRGFGKAKNDLLSRFYAMRKLHQISVVNIFFSIALFGLRISPSFIKKFLYSRFR
ncbi:glycosyltransferase [Shewanella sp. A32]|uniref:glycosyltransferase n=1 Tax=Shewanella sp. A32 TaxID=3031327 RepID=UPI0023B9F630|nr:glycosyltransferase [Shewanella sp. A32]MDF0533022.1 glycosyltransferase [Shewanella sp. A32]